MFKKKPQIKNLSPLRSSDRRKLADQIIADYHVPMPKTDTTSTDNTHPSAENNTHSSTTTPSPHPPSTLSTLRASLLPENLQSARFTTSSGPNASLVSGTIYVGSHPSFPSEDRILWFSYGKSPRLFPTVYTLWQNPGLVPLLHTPDFVVEKLQSGADLMIPGLVGGPPWPEGARMGEVVAVAGLGKERVPVWVGVCKVDVCGLGRVVGMKGVAVEGVCWAGDELWAWGGSGIGGREAPEVVEGWSGVQRGMVRAMEGLEVEDEENDEDGEGGEVDGGVSLREGTQNGHAEELDNEEQEEEDEAVEYEPTTAEIDAAFCEAFLYAVHKAKNSGAAAPKYGIDFPIQPSYLMSYMVQPNMRYQSPNYNIKKSSWKNIKKFIKHLDKEVLVKSKDRNGGETVILDIDFNDQKVKDFIPYRLPKPKTTTTSSSNTNGEVNPSIRIITLYRPSPKLYPDLLPSKTGFYSQLQITNFLKTYITANPALSQSTTGPRYLKLNPFISNTILTTSSPSDTAVLAAGEIARDALSRRLLGDTTLLSPHWILLRSSTAAEAYDPLDPTATLTSQNLKPKPYPPPAITIVLEKRTGNKTVTRISGFEAFGLIPQALAPDLQKKCAGAASVGQLVGGKPGVLEVTVQGEQADVVRAELGRRGVKGEWIKVDDRSGKKKGKK